MAGIITIRAEDGSFSVHCLECGRTKIYRRGETDCVKCGKDLDLDPLLPTTEEAARGATTTRGAAMTEPLTDEEIERFEAQRLLDDEAGTAWVFTIGDRRWLATYHHLRATIDALKQQVAEQQAAVEKLLWLSDGWVGKKETRDKMRRLATQHDGQALREVRAEAVDEEAARIHDRWRAFLVELFGGCASSIDASGCESGDHLDLLADEWRAAVAMRVTDFARAVLHGGDDHRAWLIEAAQAFVDGEPLPDPRRQPQANPTTTTTDEEG